MQREELIRILEKISEGGATDEEIGLYLKWYGSFPASADLWAELNDRPEIFRRELLAKIEHDIQGISGAERRNVVENDKEEGNGIGHGAAKEVKLWPRIRIAAGIAAAVVVVAFGIWFSTDQYRDVSTRTGSMAGVNDAAPGKNGATLTLSNGEVIALSDQKSGVVVGDVVKYSDGSDVRHSLTPSELGAEKQNLMASTGRGQTYQFTLPDGTKVWLNAESKIEFPSNFVDNKTRNVILSGEGYFEVSKDKSHPFIVATDRQEVEVLGTHFNINSYADEVSIKTTLLEGSVRINTLPRTGVSGAGIVIRPGEQATLNATSKISVKAVDVDAAIDWKQGVFVFDKASLDEIMRKLARWYDVEVADQRAVKKALTFSGRMSRYDNISKVLSKLALTGEVQFKIEGKKVLIK